MVFKQKFVKSIPLFCCGLKYKVTKCLNTCTEWEKQKLNYSQVKNVFFFFFKFVISNFKNTENFQENPENVCGFFKYRP